MWGPFQSICPFAVNLYSFKYCNMELSLKENICFWESATLQPWSSPSRKRFEIKLKWNWLPVKMRRLLSEKVAVETHDLISPCLKQGIAVGSNRYRHGYEGGRFSLQLLFFGHMFPRLLNQFRQVIVLNRTKIKRKEKNLKSYLFSFLHPWNYSFENWIDIIQFQICAVSACYQSYL